VLRLVCHWVVSAAATLKHVVVLRVVATVPTLQTSSNRAPSLASSSSKACNENINQSFATGRPFFSAFFGYALSTFVVWRQGPSAILSMLCLWGSLYLLLLQIVPKNTGTPPTSLFRRSTVQCDLATPEVTSRLSPADIELRSSSRLKAAQPTSETRWGYCATFSDGRLLETTSRCHGRSRSAP